MLWPCETSTSTCLSLATISSGLYLFRGISVLLDAKRHNSSRTTPTRADHHRLTTLSRHYNRLSQTHSRTLDSAKCERLSDRSHALTIPALSRESRIEDMLSDFAEILMPHYAPASSFFISLY